MRRKISNLLKGLCIVVLLLFLFAGFLQTPWGKVVLASSLSRSLSLSEHTELRIGKITGWVPFWMDISQVEMGDKEGIWLIAKELHFRWIVQEILEGRIRFSRLSAEKLELQRLPKSGDKKSKVKTESDGFKLLEVVFDGVNIQELTLGKGVVGMPLNYAVHSGGISLRAPGRLTGEIVLSGDAVGRVKLDALLVGSGQDQLILTAELEKMIKPTFGLDYLTGQGEVTITASGIEGRIETQLEKSEFHGEFATSLSYANRNLQFNNFDFNMDERALSGDLEMTFSNHLIDITLNSSYLDVQTNQFSVAGEVAVATSNKIWSVEIPTLVFEAWEIVSLQMSGSVTPEVMNLSGNLVEFDLGMLPFGSFSNFSGKVGGQLSVNGTLDSPEVIAGVKVSQFSSAEDTLDELPALDFSIAGGVLNGELFASTVMTNTSSGFISGSFAVPCGLSFAPYHYQLIPEKFRGQLKTELDFGFFNTLALLENQLLEGKLVADLSYESLEPTGYMRLEGARYEHYDWGVVFRDLQANLIASSNGLEFKNASATDGYAGGLALTGGIGRNGLDVQLKLDGAKVLQRPEVEAKVSGELSIGGRIARPEITGALTIDRADILLDNMVAAEPLILTDFDIYAETNTVVAAEAHSSLPFGMDITIEMPDQVAVVASLIDSMWGGTLRVRNTPAGISVAGIIKPRRGYVSFIGKKFRFEPDGEVVLDGSIPATPAFNNLVAEYSRSDITARLLLNGRVNAPQFYLESTPAMPEDEILSQVLFNRDTSTISAYQAYQIAAAAQQLSGGLNGPGFMYQFRQAVGVDTLEWREANAAGESSSVAAGKYITSDLYVEVSSSFDQEAETGMMAEYEVTRHFSVETSTGPNMRPGVGVNWKNDY